MDKPGGFVVALARRLLHGRRDPRLAADAARGHRRAARLWLWLKNTRFGTAIYAVGSDPDAARGRGRARRPGAVPGLCDRGRLLRLRRRLHQRPDRQRRSAGRQSAAAVDVRAPWSSAARGLAAGAAGRSAAIIGAYILMIVVNILLVLNVSAYYSTIAEGTILILAVLAGSLSRSSTLAQQLRSSARGCGAGAPERWSRQLRRTAPPQRLALAARTEAARPAAPARSASSSAMREMLRYALPAYVCFVLVVAGDAAHGSAAPCSNPATGTRSSCCRASSPSWRSARAR